VDVVEGPEGRAAEDSEAHGDTDEHVAVIVVLAAAACVDDDVVACSAFGKRTIDSSDTSGTYASSVTIARVSSAIVGAIRLFAC